MLFIKILYSVCSGFWMDVLFCLMEVGRIQGLEGSSGGSEQQVDEWHTVYLCLCQRALLMSSGAQTQINKRWHSLIPTCRSMKRQCTVCPPLMHYSVLLSPPRCITHPKSHCNVLFIDTLTHTVQWTMDWRTGTQFTKFCRRKQTCLLVLSVHILSSICT